MKLRNCKTFPRKNPTACSKFVKQAEICARTPGPKLSISLEQAVNKIVTNRGKLSKNLELQSFV